VVLEMSFTLVLVRGWRLAGSGPDTPCLMLPPVPLTSVEQLAGVRGEKYLCLGSYKGTVNTLASLPTSLLYKLLKKNNHRALSCMFFLGEELNKRLLFYFFNIC